MLSLSHILESQLRAAMQRAFPAVEAVLDPQLVPASKPEFGDFQANGALPLAKPQIRIELHTTAHHQR